MENFKLLVDWANRDMISILLGLVAALLVYFIGRWIAKLITRYTVRSMERAKMDEMVIRFTETLLFFGLMAAVVIAALSQAGFQTTSFTALLASVGVAIGLAIKDSLSNLAAGVMILLFRPYAINNYVEAGGTSGLVEEVQIFSTILRTPDNLKVIVPNSAVIRSNIRNYSSYDSRRIDLPVSVSLDAHIGQVRDQLVQIMRSHSMVLSEPAPTVEVQELAETSVKLVAHAWVANKDYVRVRSDLLEQIKLHLDEAKIDND
jgi:small conductance mechanosensitive channel